MKNTKSFQKLAKLDPSIIGDTVKKIVSPNVTKSVSAVKTFAGSGGVGGQKAFINALRESGKI